MNPTGQTNSRKAEYALVIAATCLSVVLHFIFMRHAGGLWRDEAGLINLAMLPGLKNMWDHIYLDSFPALWPLVVRGWEWMGFGSDTGLRVLGFVVGVGILGALWFSARCFKIRFPMFSILLLGLNPMLIIYGDSIRAWGLGVICIVLTMGLIWRVVESPNPWNVMTATLAAVASVQSTYYNSVLLFAICVASSAVAARRRNWKGALLPLGIGLIAAISMLAYIGTIRHGTEHYRILRCPYYLQNFLDKLSEVMAGHGAFWVELFSLPMWGLLLASGFVMAIVCQFLPKRNSITTAQQDLMLFGFLITVIAVVAYFVFLQKLMYITQSWYYLGLIAIMAVSIDAMLSVMDNWKRGMVIRRALVVMFLCVEIVPVGKAIQLRMTNVDLIAVKLNDSAAKNDLIIVNPWFLGPSFDRYYHGNAPWMTVPAIPDHKFHRYDLLKNYMDKPDQKQAIQDVLDQMSQTLKSGGGVWVVGGFEFNKNRPKPPVTAKSKYISIPSNIPVQDHWSILCGEFILDHAAKHEKITVANAAINQFEMPELVFIQGWKDKVSTNEIAPAKPVSSR